MSFALIFTINSYLHHCVAGTMMNKLYWKRVPLAACHRGTPAGHVCALSMCRRACHGVIHLGEFCFCFLTEFYLNSAHCMYVVEYSTHVVRWTQIQVYNNNLMSCMGHWRAIQRISIRGPLRLDIHTPRLTSSCNHHVSSIIILLGCTVAAAAVRASELKSYPDWLRQNYMENFSTYYEL